MENIGLGINHYNDLANVNNNLEWKYISGCTLGGNVKLPSKFKELYISMYDASNKNVFLSLTIPYIKLATTRQSFYAGYIWTTSRYTSACASISQTELQCYGMSVNGTEISTPLFEVYYR